MGTSYFRFLFKSSVKTYYLPPFYDGVQHSIYLLSQLSQDYNYVNANMYNCTIYNHQRILTLTNVFLVLTRARLNRETIFINVNLTIGLWNVGEKSDSVCGFPLFSVFTENCKVITCYGVWSSLYKKVIQMFDLFSHFVSMYFRFILSLNIAFSDLIFTQLYFMYPGTYELRYSEYSCCVLDVTRLSRYRKK